MRRPLPSRMRNLGAPTSIVGFVTALFLIVAVAATRDHPCAFCEPGRLPPAVDFIAVVSLVASGILLRVRRPHNAIWLLLVVAAWGRLTEVTLAYLGASGTDVAWHTIRNLLLVAVPWHIALIFPTGRGLRGFGWVPIAWYTWAVAASTLRAIAMDFGHLVERGSTAFVREGVSPGTWEPVLATIPMVSDLLILISVVTILVRWWNGNRSVRRAFAPLFFVLPFLLLEVLDEVVGDIPLLDLFGGISILTQQIVALALPFTVVLGIVGPRIWEGRIAVLIDDLETAVTLSQVERATRVALEDQSVQVLAWLPERRTWSSSDGSEHAEPPGEMVTRVVLDGETLGCISHDQASDLPLLRSIASTVALALRRIQLQAEVQARLEEVRRSRQRIVEAADDARRAIERDLHDGAQQSLVVLAMTLDLEKAEFDDPNVHRVLDAAADQARRALEEIRNLSKGMYPQSLSSGGLPLAIEGLADASPIPTDVDVVDERFDHKAETTAYFVVAECLANAAKHSEAESLHVRVTRAGGTVVVEVSDDGVGGASPSGGSGIMGLEDRVEALGGTLGVWSPPSGGTTITAVIPLEAETAGQRSG